MDAAIATEALKLRRSPVARTGWLAVVLGVPALTAALTAAALWVGMGGPEAAATIEPTQLLLALPVSAAGIWATTSWWNHAQLT